LRRWPVFKRVNSSRADTNDAVIVGEVAANSML
jgi:hypothetical protein